MTSTHEPKVVISGRGEERIRSGHPWIYRTDVADAIGSVWVEWKR